MDKVAAVVGIIRHILTFAGGALVALGLVSSTDWATGLTSFDGVTGGAIALVGLVASIINKTKGFNWSALFSSTPTPPTTPPAA